MLHAYINIQIDKKYASMMIAKLIFIFFTLTTAGCQKGACYYACCNSEDECSIDCQFKIDSAKQCAILAQNTCEQSDYPNVHRIEWEEINELLCDSCSSPLCAPSWWTEKQLADQYPLDAGLYTDAGTKYSITYLQQ